MPRLAGSSVMSHPSPCQAALKLLSKRKPSAAEGAQRVVVGAEITGAEGDRSGRPGARQYVAGERDQPLLRCERENRRYLRPAQLADWIEPRKLQPIRCGDGAALHGRAPGSGRRSHRQSRGRGQVRAWGRRNRRLSGRNGRACPSGNGCRNRRRGSAPRIELSKLVRAHAPRRWSPADNSVSKLMIARVTRPRYQHRRNEALSGRCGSPAAIVQADRFRPTFQKRIVIATPPPPASAHGKT